MKNHIISIFLICVLLVSCAPEKVQNVPVPIGPVGQSSRIVVIDASRFTSADNRVRDILVLRDTQTGEEFIAVMGAGVVQIDLETCGKGCIREVEGN